MFIQLSYRMEPHRFGSNQRLYERTYTLKDNLLIISRINKNCPCQRLDHISKYLLQTSTEKYYENPIHLHVPVSRGLIVDIRHLDYSYKIT